ncbi:MAG: selenocysteine-specific translation elongation factor [bacterium]
MKQKVTFCTAGHIDHGKSALVRTLTGKDPDTRPEEKKRGMTIDLGFAYLPIVGKEVAIIIDVPGHEDFIRTMIAGSWGVDYFLMVIAGDEGVMPQTTEHADVLRFVGLKTGVIAISRIDLASEKQRLSAIEEAEILIEEMGFEDVRIIETSAITNVGIDELKNELIKLAKRGPRERDIDEPFFLPIDRVFSITGYGTIVAGTVASGIYRLGTPLRLLPHNTEVRVRGVQIHFDGVQEVLPGQRAGFNLPKVDVEDVKRGDYLVEGDIFKLTELIVISYDHSKRTERPLLHRQRVRLLTATREIIGRMSILDKGVVYPGDNGICQFTAEEPFLTRFSDPVVVCDFSSKRVLGGGKVLDPHSLKIRRREDIVKRYRNIEEEGERGLIKLIISEIPPNFLIWSEDDISSRTGFSLKRVREVIKTIEGEILRIDGGFIAPQMLSEFNIRVRKTLENFHIDNPMSDGVDVGSLCTALGFGIEQKSVFIKILAMVGGVGVEEGKAYLKDVRFRLNKSQRSLADRLLKGLMPEKDEIKILGMSEIEKSVGAYDEKNLEVVLTYLEKTGEIVRLFGNQIVNKVSLDNAIVFLNRVLKERGSVRVSEFKDIAGISRRDATSLLDYLNVCGYTKRISGTHYPPDYE